MSKKVIYISLSIILILVLAFLWYTYSTQTSDGGTTGKTNIFRNFLPFGGNENTNTDNNGGGGEIVDNNDNQVENPPVDFVKKLRKITSEQVAGAGVLDVKAGTVIRYIEKATGHIYEVELFSPRQGRISNTTMPRVYDAVWSSKNNSLLTRYLKDDDKTVETFSITLKNTSTTTENVVSGTAISDNISDLSIFGESLFYLEEGNGFSSGFISNINGSGKKQVWNSPLKSLVSQYVNGSTVSLTTKEEENTPGFMYFVNTSNGSYRKILGNIKGLTTLTNNGATKVLYLSQEEGADLFLYDLVSKSTEKITPETYPEKCVFSKKNVDLVYCLVPKDFIDKGSITVWYKGLYSSSDDVWKYDLKNKTSDIVANLNNESGEDLDGIKPLLSENEQYLVFINKKDNSLWSLDLTK